MSTGVSQGTGKLVVRKTAEGVKVEGDPPQRHEFPVKFLDRELNSAVRILIEVAGHRWEVSAIEAERGEDGGLKRVNSLVGSLLPPHVPEPQPAKKKRRWFRRRKNG